MCNTYCFSTTTILKRMRLQRYVYTYIACIVKHIITSNNEILFMEVKLLSRIPKTSKSMGANIGYLTLSGWKGNHYSCKW